MFALRPHSFSSSLTSPTNPTVGGVPNCSESRSLPKSGRSTCFVEKNWHRGRYTCELCRVLRHLCYLSTSLLGFSSNVAPTSSHTAQLSCRLPLPKCAQCDTRLQLLTRHLAFGFIHIQSSTHLRGCQACSGDANYVSYTVETVPRLRVPHNSKTAIVWVAASTRKGTAVVHHPIRTARAEHPPLWAPLPLQK